LCLNHLLLLEKGPWDEPENAPGVNN